MIYMYDYKFIYNSKKSKQLILTGWYETIAI